MIVNPPTPTKEPLEGEVDLKDLELKDDAKFKASNHVVK